MPTVKTTSTLKDLFKFGSIGILMGFLFIGIAEARISYKTIMNNKQSLLNHFNAGTETQYLLGKAAYEAFKGEDESTISILSPNIDKFKNRMEAAEAYFYLGTSELNLGHPQLAAGYFELMYANNPTSYCLFLVAVAYDQAGNLDVALQKYALVVSFQDQTTQPNNLAHAQQRIKEIMTIKGISNPTQ